MARLNSKMKVRRYEVVSNCRKSCGKRTSSDAAIDAPGPLDAYRGAVLDPPNVRCQQHEYVHHCLNFSITSRLGWGFSSWKTV
jgi:hypothetical protein